MGLNVKGKPTKNVGKKEHFHENEVGRILKQNLKVLNHREKRLAQCFNILKSKENQASK